MLAHRLRHRVEIQEQIETQNQTTGDITYTWSTVYLDSDTPLDAVPAEVLTGPGREFNGGDTKQAETDARINIRWFAELDQKMRIVWDGKNYDITGMETDTTARREWRLRCKEGVSDGS